MPKVHYEIRLQGRVQGVGFRYQIKEYADEHNIRGYARNLRDRSVSLEIEGDEEILNKFIVWCKSNINLANVEDISIQIGEIKGFGEFQTY